MQDLFSKTNEGDYERVMKNMKEKFESAKLEEVESEPQVVKKVRKMDEETAITCRVWGLVECAPSPTPEHMQTKSEELSNPGSKETKDTNGFSPSKPQDHIDEPFRFKQVFQEYPKPSFGPLFQFYNPASPMMNNYGNQIYSFENIPRSPLLQSSIFNLSLPFFPAGRLLMSNGVFLNLFR